jgi:hypothetical protein
VRWLVIAVVTMIVVRVALAVAAPRPGWLSQRYANERFMGPVETSTALAIPGSVRIDERTGPLSIRWTGRIKPEHAATRTITLTACGSATLLIDAAPLLWIGATREPASVTKDVTFTPGDHLLTLGYVKPADTDPLISLTGFEDGGSGDMLVTPAPVDTGARHLARWARPVATALDAGAVVTGVVLAWLVIAAARRPGKAAACAAARRSGTAAAVGEPTTREPTTRESTTREPFVLSRRKQIAFAMLTFLLVLVVSAAGVLAFDVYLHHRVQYTAGVNVWGYRGDPVGKKQSGETRIVVLGGSTAFGYGLPWNEAWPHYLEQKINARRMEQTPVKVINLGIPGDSARTFVTTLKDYEYLAYDIACLYEGYNDLGQGGEFRNPTNPGVMHYLEWRYQSPIFRWTGYFPIFPLVLNEKAMAIRYGGNLNAAYGTGKVLFRPNLATRTTAAALETASALGVKMEKTFAHAKPVLSEATDGGCGRWAQYCGAVADAVQQTIARGKRAVVITQPYLADIHVEQQAAMSTMLARRFGGDPRVRYVNLGRLLNIHDTSVVYDGIHLVARGNEMVADALTPVMLDIIK